MVQTVLRTILCFLPDLLMRCKLRPKLRCAGCTQTRIRPFAAEILGNGCHGLPRTHLFISLYLLGPRDNADPQTSQQIRPFPLKREAENIHAVSHVLLSQFFSLPQESSQVSTNQMQDSSNTTNCSQNMSSKAFGPRTQLHRNSSNCPN